ncbi:MAG: putative CAAX amino terminal protease self-immunity [Promethearchaeota archaeon]|nr:MAG: putative CAAX amino terminal protease self-immunity [Candidatus Lokiarchaeota archaeon]
MVKKFVEKNALSLFFIICYSGMIVAVLIQVLFKISSFTPENFNLFGFILWIFQAFNPTIAALFITGIIHGRDGIKHLFRGFLKYRVGFFWYFAAFLLILAPLALAIFYTLFTGAWKGITFNASFPLFIATLLFSIFSGPLSEEMGWRGFALPRIESRFSALVSSLLLGFLWFLWHIPLYFVPDSSQMGIPPYIYIALVISISILMTWAYNNTEGSLLITFLFHFCFNYGTVLIINQLKLIPTIVYYIGGSIMIGIYIIVVISYSGIQKFSKKPDEVMPFKKTSK